MIRALRRSEQRHEIASEIPLNRTNTVEDVAAAVLFLASPQSRNVTGQSLNVDGGMIWDEGGESDGMPEGTSRFAGSVVASPRSQVLSTEHEA